MTDKSLQRIIAKVAKALKVTVEVNTREWDDCQRATSTNEVRAIITAAIREGRLTPTV